MGISQVVAGGGVEERHDKEGDPKGDHRRVEHHEVSGFRGRNLIRRAYRFERGGRTSDI
jgi:hypothetical protein